MTLRLRLLALLAGLIASTGLVAATAAAAANCVFRMDSLTAKNLLNDGGIDFVFLKFNNNFYPVNDNDGVPFAEGDKNVPRPASVFGQPVEGVGAAGMPNRLIFDRFPVNHPIDGRKVTCGDQVRELTYDGGDAKYVVHYRLTF
ncbi:hypothetical protein GCM10009557_82820 [Virgisporangium ochraceum]|uniref:Uncharacterized protein n=1 Tax=Virgisporangium ochraceum TaxID=65505 RepID=A0A8J3ZQM5_9ACTN|nr:hypothetical protein [Virgisporangium ochraceum]GIJ67233.1 hypothetical protein Voc01_021500 [Virgisporangium ochraceum]